MGRRAIKKLALGVIAFAVVFGALLPSAMAAGQLTVNADSYLLADFKTGRILAEHNSDSPHIPASLVKLMSLYIAFDEIASGRIGLDDDVPISERAWLTGGSKMFVLVGTKVKLRDLIKGITVASGNDACVALAEYIEGDVDKFVGRMNSKARDLGLSNTRFVDPHGLSDQNSTTAKDLFALVRAYVKDHPEALEYHALREFTYAPPGEKPITQFNRNTLLWTVPGTYGLKTGYTSKAGFNMVALCERGGFSVIAIVLGSAKGKPIEEGERERSAIVTGMLEYAYREYSYVEVMGPGANVGRVRVWKGRGKWADMLAPNGLGATVEKGKEKDLQWSVRLRTDLQAPVTKGSKVGEAVFLCNGATVGVVDLVAAADVPRGNVFRVVWDGIIYALMRAFGKA